MEHKIYSCFDRKSYSISAWKISGKFDRNKQNNKRCYIQPRNEINSNLKPSFDYIGFKCERPRRPYEFKHRSGEKGGDKTNEEVSEIYDLD